MDLTKNSKLLTKLGNRFYSSNLDDLDIPCSSEEFYSDPVERPAIQPLLNPLVVGEEANKRRALFIDTKRRYATEQIALATIPALFAVFLAYSSISAVIAPGSTDRPQISSKSDADPSMFSMASMYAGAMVTKAKTRVAIVFMSDDEKLLRAKKISRQQLDIQKSAGSKEELISKLIPLEAEFNSLNGDYLMGMEAVKLDAERIKTQLSNGSITQDQFNTQKLEIMARKQKLDDSQK